MFAAFDYSSFFSVWYWVLTVVIWTLVCHRTLGVPYDMIVRAERLPPVAAEVDAVARIAAARLAGIYRTLGVWLASGTGFVLAVLGVLGFSARLEAAQAGFILLLPLAFVGLQTLRLGVFVARTGLVGGELRRQLCRRRAWNQTIAIAAMITAAALAVFHHPALAFLRY